MPTQLLGLLKCERLSVNTAHVALEDCFIEHLSAAELAADY